MLQFVTVFDAEGYLAYSSNGTRDHLFFGDREHFRIHADRRDDQLFISKPIIGRIANVPLIQLTRPIRDGERFFGVIGIPLRPDYLSDNLRSLKVDPADMLAIVRLDGTLIARSHRLEEALKTRLPADRPFIGAQAGQRGLFRSDSAVDGVPLLFSWQRLAAWPLSAVSAIDEDAELAAMRQYHAAQRRNALLAMGLVLSFAFGVAMLVLWISRQNEALARSESRLAALLDTASDGIHILDEAGRLVQSSPSFLAMLGYRPEEAAALQMADWDVRIPVEKLPDFVRDLMRVQRRFETQFRCKDGRLVEVEINARGMEIGGQRLLYASARDIGERKQAEAAATKANSLLQEAIHSVAEGFTLFDEQDRLVACNEAYLTLYNTSRDLIVPGATFEEIVRRGAERGQYREAVGRVDAWVA